MGRQAWEEFWLSELSLQLEIEKNNPLSLFLRHEQCASGIY